MAKSLESRQFWGILRDRWRPRGDKKIVRVGRREQEIDLLYKGIMVSAFRMKQYNTAL